MKDLIFGKKYATGSSNVIVSDADAQLFVNAALISVQSQGDAINNLVISLKANNIWSKLKALYPFIGGSASSHKFNLKDPRDLNAAFRLSFSGTWTHTATGALPGGSSYANTNLSPTSVLSIDNCSLSVYLRTNPPNSFSFPIDIGCMDNNYNNRFWMCVSPSSGGSTFYDLKNRLSVLNSSVNVLGFHSVSRISASLMSAYNNASKIATTNSVTASYGFPSANIYLSSSPNIVDGFSKREMAFAAIGFALTDAESLLLYNIIQAYQTSLNRQV